MASTCGINHLGLSVRSLSETTHFFVDALGWEMQAFDDSYPRSTVSDGKLRLTLWQVDLSAPVVAFDRHANVGLHHLAIEVESEERLNEIYKRICYWAGVEFEFKPELLGGGPRKHMMFTEPGGIRLELIWPGT